MDRTYDFKRVEDRWTKDWGRRKAWAAPEMPDENARYIVTMLRTHPAICTGPRRDHVDQRCDRSLSTVRGHQVLNPIGGTRSGSCRERCDKARDTPQDLDYENIAKHRASMERLGLSFDWDRVFYTCEPDTTTGTSGSSSVFTSAALAYRKKARRRLPQRQDVLANEQVIRRPVRALRRDRGESAG